MSSYRSKSCIQDFVIHTLESLDLIIDSRIRNTVRIKKMRHHSFDDKIGMTLEFIDNILQLIFLNSFTIHTGIEKQMDLRRFFQSSKMSDSTYIVHTKCCDFMIKLFVIF